MSEPAKEELRELLAIGLRAADVARDVVMPLFESDIGSELKADGTPVTAADRDAEEAIRRFIERECPGHGVLGEEFGESPSSGPYRWVVDPIDGTKAFVHRVPLFGTLIALEYQGAPVAGIIACHAAKAVIAGAKGLGATLNGRPVRVSNTDSLERSTALMTSVQSMYRYHPRAFAALNDRANLVRTWGDCFGYLSVGAGRAELMVDPVMNYWDVAALYPVITEAGGRITTIDGALGPGGSVVATNGLLHDEVLGILALDASS